MILPTLLILAQVPDAEDPVRMFVAGSTEAFYMEPPELAAKPFVNRVVWTADGSTLVSRRLVPPAGTNPLAIADARQTIGLEGMMKLHPRNQLVAWSKNSRNSRTLLDTDAAHLAILEMEPMTASDRLLVLVAESQMLPDGTLGASHEAYILISTATGATVRLWTATEHAQIDTRIALSPKRAFGTVIQGTSDTGRKVSFFGPDGKPGPLFTIPPKKNFGYASDGGPGIGGVELDKRGKKVYVFRRMDPKTGSIREEAVSIGYDEPVEPRLKVTTSKAPKEGIYLEAKGGKPDEVGLVSVDGALPVLSPLNDAVAYVLGNGAYVRSLVKVDRKAYDAAMLEAGKQKAMQAAKQVGLAMSMYAMDSDDAFPPSDGDGKKVVDPYLKNRSMLDSFTYTFGGGTASGNPGSTELGYVAGPGGRAVVYADGTVKWVPDGF